MTAYLNNHLLICQRYSNICIHPIYGSLCVSLWEGHIQRTGSFQVRHGWFLLWGPLISSPQEDRVKLAELWAFPISLWSVLILLTTPMGVGVLLPTVPSGSRFEDQSHRGSATMQDELGQARGSWGGGRMGEAQARMPQAPAGLTWSSAVFHK